MSNQSAWSRVEAARNPKRPTAQYYIKHIFDDFLELHGDRAFADDGAVIGGVGFLGDTPVTIIGQEKGSTLQDKASRNFGCAHPEGYRKSLRLMKNAEKFGRPIICIVDTQGAYCGIGAEERGMGQAIAENLLEMSTLRVPIVSVLIGEGGSGGALGLAVANRVAMLENAVYSILSPEGFASILWKDGSRVKEAAELMKITAREVHALGIVEEVLPEPMGGAHIAPELAAANVKDFLVRSLKELTALSPEELVSSRYERFRKIGQEYIVTP